MNDSIKVFSPATVSNIACGFDIMGFALEKPGDEIIIRKNNKFKINITKITGDNNTLSYDINKNTASFSILKIYQDLKIPYGIDIEIHKKMKIGTGLGSSAASSAAAVYALNELFHLKLTDSELVNYSIYGESIASGAFHADNVAPSLLGGFILIRGYEPLDIIKLKTKLNLYCTIISPNIEIKTKEARNILPKEIKLKTAIEQWGNVAGLITGLLNNDKALISRSLYDKIAEPYRANLIPNYYDIKETALENGAIGCNISGSGPSIFALSDDIQIAENIKTKISNIYEKKNVKYYSFISKINNNGTIILD